MQRTVQIGTAYYHLLIGKQPAWATWSITMKFLKTKVIVILATYALSSVTSANDDIWFGVKAGTLGFGAEVSWRPIGWLDVRAGTNFYDYDDSGSQAGVNYDATLALDTFYLTGNFRFPLSPFRLTAGAFTNNNELTLASQDATSFLIGSNPNPYSSADVGTIQSVASFDSVAPYLGAGFDFDLMDRLGLSLDFGVLWQGDPNVTISATGLLGSNASFLADLEAERQELLNKVEDLKAYPVISIGFNFNF